MPRWYSGAMYEGEKLIELNNCTGRVVPRDYGGGYAWSAHAGHRSISAPSKSGHTRTQTAAKRAAVKACKRFG